MKKLLFIIFVILLLQLFISARSIAQNKPGLVELPQNSSISITGQSIFKFLCADPSIARIRKTAQNKVIIKGIAPGTTYLFLWDEGNSLTTIKIIVLKNAESSDIDVKSSNPVQYDQYENLRIKYTGSFYNGSSVSQYSSNLWSYSGSFNQFSFSGRTPLGNTSSMVQHESNNGINGITYLRLDASNDNYYLNLGDNSVSFSDISLPYMNYQGFYFKSSILKNTEFTFAGGSRGNGYWGKSVRNDTRPTLPFLAAKATIKPIQPLELTISSVSASREGSGDQATITTLAGKYYLMNSMSLAGEASFASYGRRAWTAGTEYFGQNLFLKGAYKHVPQDFQTASDTTNSRGIEGYFISGSFKPLSFIQMNGEVNRYKNTYLQGANNSQNQETNADIRLILAPNSVFSFSPWMQDHSGFVSGGIGEGAITQLSYGFEFFGSDVIYFRYEPVKFRDSRTSEADFIEDRKAIGARFNINKALNFSFENRTGAKTLTASNVVENTNALNISMNFDSAIGTTLFYTVFNSNYSTGTDAGGRFNQIYGDLELGYKFAQDSKMYVRGKLADYRGAGTNNIDRTENHINFGVQYPLDTKIAFKGEGSIKGIVFTDKNEDGIYSDDERALSSAVIIVNNKRFQTDGSGRYFVKGIKAGKVKIALDLNSVNKGGILTVQNPMEINVKSGQTSVMDFGVINRSMIKVKIFKDANIPVAGIKLYLNDNAFVSDSDGMIIITGANDGIHDLQIDLNSIPQGILPLVPVKQKITVFESDNLEISIPFKTDLK